MLCKRGKVVNPNSNIIISHNFFLFYWEKTFILSQGFERWGSWKFCSIHKWDSAHTHAIILELFYPLNSWFICHPLAARSSCNCVGPGRVRGLCSISLSVLDHFPWLQLNCMQFPLVLSDLIQLINTLSQCWVLGIFVTWQLSNNECC